jgi:hypothetical protein
MFLLGIIGLCIIIAEDGDKIVILRKKQEAKPAHFSAAPRPKSNPQPTAVDRIKNSVLDD